MKQFLKTIFASCLGTILVLALLVLALVVIVQISKPVTKIKDDSVLKIELTDPIPELTDNVEESPFNLKSGSIIGLHEITQLLESAKTDDKINAILLQTQYPMVGAAASEAIFDAIQSFKESGKPVYAYGDFYSQTGYYLASQADSIFLNPNGFIELRGYAAIVPFYKELMEKFGVKMNVYYAGKYKSATEPYREDEMSEESRYQTREYLNDITQNLLERIGEQRNLSRERMNQIVAEFNSHNSESAIDLNLADKISYWNEFENSLRKAIELDSSKTVNYVELSEYGNYIRENKKYKSNANKIAIVHAEGDILYQSDQKGAVGYDKYANILRKLKKKKDVKAVVLRVNSPGGSALASDLLWKEVKDLKDAGKKVVASFGNYAASGGYYIAAPSDAILAESNSLTGSIGAYLMIPETKELFEEKIGIHFDTVKTHPFAVIWNPLFNVQEKEAQITEQLTEDLYQKFLSRVAEGRNMTMDAVHENAQGRVWSGVDALEVGLVDQIGGLDDAITKSAELAELEDYKVIEYPKIERNIYLEMLSEMMGETKLKTNVIPEVAAKEYKPVFDYINMLSQQQGPQMRLPFHMDIR